MKEEVSRASRPPIKSANRSELTQIYWLLHLENLPYKDLTEDSLAHFLVSRDTIGITGVVGLEYYGILALLRSLVVTDDGGWVDASSQRPRRLRDAAELRRSTYARPPRKAISVGWNFGPSQELRRRRKSSVPVNFNPYVRQPQY
jgi:hypothetical protein